MRKTLLLFALASLTTSLAEARQAHVSLHSASRQDQLKAIRLQISRLTRNSKDAQAYAKGANGPVRLTAIGQNDYANNFGVLDSLMFTYSGTRGSSFDFDNLDYDTYNSNDLPGYSGSMGSYIQYDTMREYTTANTPALQTTGLRQYNSAGKVTLTDQINTSQTNRTVFEYNNLGEPSKATFLNYDASSAQWDSSSRDFYIYSSAGYLLRDSSETWNGASWDPEEVLAYTNNSSGLPTFINYGFDAGGGVIVSFATVSLTFSGTHLTKEIVQLDQGNGLENIFKDSVGYNGVVRTYDDGYNWDDNNNVWVISSQQRRHLNTASLPDSVWSRVDNSGMGQFDTTIQKITYNTDGTPARRRTYLPGLTSLQNDERWYYKPAPSAISGPVALAAAVMVYPNPADNFISFRSPTSGNGSYQYQIVNTAGALAAQGTVLSGAAIPVGSLPAGLYLLHIVDDAGTAVKAQFVKR